MLIKVQDYPEVMYYTADWQVESSMTENELQSLNNVPKDTHLNM